MTDRKEITEITKEDMDKFVNNLLKNEITLKKCSICNKKYLHSYGENFQECDECFFKRFPKEEVQKFCKSFF
jgi:hypothetical protein